MVVLAVRDDSRVLDAAHDLHAALDRAGVRPRVDAVGRAFGRRVTDWELKGVPLRVEIGPRDLDAGAYRVTRRDTGTRLTLTTSEIAQRAPGLLDEMQDELLAGAEQRLADRIVDTTSVDDARAAARTGFARIPWRDLGEDGEAALAADAISVRCLQTPDGGIPDDVTGDDVMAVVGRSY